MTHIALTPINLLAPRCIEGPRADHLCTFTGGLYATPAPDPGAWLTLASSRLAGFFSDACSPPAACWMMDGVAESGETRWRAHAFASSYGADSVPGRLFAAEVGQGFQADDARGPHVRAFGLPQALCLPRAGLYLAGTWETSAYRDLCGRAGVHEFIRCVHPLDQPGSGAYAHDARRCLLIEVQGRDPGWRADDAKTALLHALSGAVAAAFEHRFLRLERARAGLKARISPAAHPVLPLLAEGFSETEIGRRIYRSVHTVHDHVKQIYRALGISTRIELRDLWMGYDGPRRGTRPCDGPGAGTRRLAP